MQELHAAGARSPVDDAKHALRSCLGPLQLGERHLHLGRSDVRGQTKLGSPRCGPGLAPVTYTHAPLTPQRQPTTPLGGRARTCASPIAQ